MLALSFEKQCFAKKFGLFIVFIPILVQTSQRMRATKGGYSRSTHTKPPSDGSSGVLCFHFAFLKVFKAIVLSE